jgi:hypothetical protein
VVNVTEEDKYKKFNRCAVEDYLHNPSKPKVFVIDCQERGCKDFKDSLKVFENWHEKYYPHDKYEVLRIKSARSHIIFYQILPSEKQRVRVIHGV